MKKLVVPLLHAFEKHMDATFKVHRLVRLALKASADIEDILDQNPTEYRLDDDEARNFENACFRYAQCVASLGAHFHPMGIWLFHFTIKQHMLLHCGMMCREVSPRLAWCYSGEDLMAKVKGLVQASCHGSTPQRMVHKVMQKYSVGLSYQLLDANKWWR